MAGKATTKTAASAQKTPLTLQLLQFIRLFGLDVMHSFENNKKFDMREMNEMPRSIASGQVISTV